MIVRFCYFGLPPCTHFAWIFYDCFIYLVYHYLIVVCFTSSLVIITRFANILLFRFPSWFALYIHIKFTNTSTLPNAWNARFVIYFRKEVDVHIKRTHDCKIQANSRRFDSRNCSDPGFLLKYN